MPTKTPKQPDQTRLIASLATECQVPIGEMTQLYEQERASLALGAHITKFLHIFASRNVLEIIRKRRLVTPTSTPPGASAIDALIGPQPLLPA
jgi:hypothetical protein